MTTMTSSSLSTDQRKFLAAKLLRNVHLKLVCASICASQKFERGSGLTGYFVRYKRMNVPLTAMSEGVDPTPSSFTIEQVTVTLEQWSDALEITDVAKLTTAHPVMTIAQQLLAENAQRVIDREVQLVWLAGTEVTYGDGTVTTRATITKDMKATDDVLGKIYVTLGDGGAQPRGSSGGTDNMTKASATGGPSTLVGPKGFIAITDMFVTQDVRRAAAAYGTWAAVNTFHDGDAIRRNAVGTWNGFVFVETNFIPKYTRLGNATTAVASGNAFGTDTPVVTAAATGGTIAATTAHYFKVTRKDKTRGFEEAISIEHSMDSAGGVGVNSFTFNFSGLTAGYVYNVYFGSSSGDANLKQHATTNIEVGTTLTVTAVPGTSITAPANLRASADGDDPSALHLIYFHGEESCIWTDLQDLQFFVIDNTPSYGNLVGAKQWVSYKFLGKAMRCNEDFMHRLEIATTNN